jgi:hypothetical protein
MCFGCYVKIDKSAFPWFAVLLSVRLSILLKIQVTHFSAFQFHCFIYYGGALPCW